MTTEQTMANPRQHTVSPGWRIVLLDVGIDPANVLRRAGLPADLLSRSDAQIDTPTLFRLWEAIDAEGDDPRLALRLGSAVSAESFDPPVFAALCSPHLNTALLRIARYKPLICPMRLLVDVGPETTALEVAWPDTGLRPPALIALTELTFFVQIARMATRENIVPLELSSPSLPRDPNAFEEWFGCPVEEGERLRIVFRAEDASRPFLTANDAMWSFFEADLSRRLSELDETATTAHRVRAALLEMLPGGAPSMSQVARELGTSTRTLQRRLKAESTTYQSVLTSVRERLARHYLRNTALSGSEISYLLGYEDPNCFFRAYRQWTGSTPGHARAQMEAAQTNQ